MTQTDQINRAEMKRFLLHEFDETEREAFEERFFLGDDFFYELTDLENELVDRYALGKMSPSESARFEKSLQKSPERREKVTNSIALQKFIAEQKLVIAQPTLREKIAGFIHIQKYLFQYATAALLILLMAGFGFLLSERARVVGELARLQNEQRERESELERQENALHEQIKQAQEREQNLQKELENKNGQTQILIEQIEREKSEKLKLERELEILRKETAKSPIEKPREIQPQPPIIATLLPYSGGKGGGGSDTKIIKIKLNTEKIRLSLKIPIESTDETFDANLDGANLANGLNPQRNKAGNRVLFITLSSAKLGETEHSITLIGSNKSVSYIFRLQRQ